MLSSILKAYRYYHYRLYLFSLHNLQLDIFKAYSAAFALMFATFMINMGVLAVLLLPDSKTPIFPDPVNHRHDAAVPYFILIGIYMLFNYLVLPERNHILDEFKDEEETAFKKRGWIISIYLLSSWLIFLTPVFSIDGERSVIDSMPIPVSRAQDSLKKVKMDSTVIEIRKNGYP